MVRCSSLGFVLPVAAALALGVSRGAAPLYAEEGPAAAPAAEAVRQRVAALEGRVKALLAERKRAQALTEAREALSQAEAVLGSDALETATCLFVTAGLLAADGDAAQAQAQHERALAIRERALGAEHDLVALSLNDLGVLFLEQRNAARARPLLERALAIRERLHGEKDPSVAASSSTLGWCLMLMGNLPKAQTHFERALAILDGAGVSASDELANVLLGLGQVKRYRGNAPAARGDLERLVEITRKRHGESSPEMALPLSELAGLLGDLGKPREALPLAQEALARREAALGPDHLSVGQSLSTVAVLWRSLGEYAKALPLCERALAIGLRGYGPDHPETASLYSNLGVIQSSLDLVDQARANHERALAIREKALPREHPDLALSLSNLAVLLGQQGDLAGARPLAERALAIYRKVYGLHPAVARSLDNLAMIQRQVGDLAGAIASTEEALHLWERFLGKNHEDVAICLDNLAGLLVDKGDLAGALEKAERARAIWQDTLGDDHPSLAHSLTNLVAVLRQQGAFDRAIPLSERALQIWEGALGKEHPLVLLGLHNLASTYAVAGQPERAGPLLQRALALLAKRMGSLVGGLAPEERVQVLARQRGVVDAWMGYTAQAKRSGLSEVLPLIGLVARVTEAERVALRRGGPEVGKRLEELRQTRRLLARLAHGRPRKSDTAGLEAWRKSWAEASAAQDKLAAALARDVAPMRQTLERAALTVSGLQARLAADEALVLFLRAGPAYVVWILRARGAEVRVDLMDPAAIDAAVAAVQAGMKPEASAEAEAAAAQALGQLRTLVWEPLQPHLAADVRSVTIVPDGALTAVPFAALPGRAAGKVLLDDLSVSCVAVPHDLVPRSDRPALGSGGLALGDVDYKQAQDPPPATAQAQPVALARTRAATTRRFRPLEETGKEIEAVARSLSDCVVLRGSEATEGALRERCSGRRWLHLATHGFVSSELDQDLARDPQASGWLGAFEERQLARGNDPLLLAGLALAGANPRQGGGDDDGILTAAEVSSLPLDGCELVVLSACESARGTIQSGEGVVGLVQAFQMAGARRVLATLWEVDDEAARMWMERLYAGLLNSRKPLSMQQAAREASLWLRGQTGTGGRSFASPRYWAPFVAYGR